MKVEDYKCNICKEALVNVDEFIGFGIKDTGEFYPRPVEKAKNHICGCCLDGMAAFKIKWRNKDKMNPAALHSWELSW